MLPPDPHVASRIERGRTLYVSSYGGGEVIETPYRRDAQRVQPYSHDYLRAIGYTIEPLQTNGPASTGTADEAGSETVNRG